MKYRKKPVVIEAVKFTGKNHEELRAFCPCIQISYDGNTEGVVDATIVTLEGIMEASPGDYIIRGVKGEFYPCKPDIFTETYEPVEE